MHTFSCIFILIGDDGQIPSVGAGNLLHDLLRVDKVKNILADKIERYENKGMNKKLRAMFVGIPNVGKSSLINKICGSKKAKVENRPGVTVNKQWIPTSVGFDLMDMPGVLWPKFEEKVVGENLAITGAIKDAILDTE